MLRGLIPTLMMAVAVAQAPQDSANPQRQGGAFIPAELTKTIRAESAQRGDPVEFKTLEAVLIRNGLVMPANTKLQGRVVGAAPRQGDKPSWLVVLIERAAWKNQSVSLHAYISSQLSISSTTRQGLDTVNGMPNPDQSSAVRPREWSGRGPEWRRHLVVDTVAPGCEFVFTTGPFGEIGTPQRPAHRSRQRRNRLPVLEPVKRETPERDSVRAAEPIFLWAGQSSCRRPPANGTGSPPVDAKLAGRRGRIASEASAANAFWSVEN